MPESQLLATGIVTWDDLKQAPGFPGEKRLKEGPVAVIECLQQIPCNPCEEACPYGAISVGEPITNLPRLAADKCRGCGLCIPACPGQAIFVVDNTLSGTEAAVSFPFEFLPVPKPGQRVAVVNRAGEVVGEGNVTRVLNPPKYDRTMVVTVAVPKSLADEVRGIALPANTSL
ncbi:MAG: 4Fe-4S dicluster domain-containing protein [Syntrophothermus sp.]